MTTLIILDIILVILGIVILTGKGDFLIAGYNTAKKEEKEKVNVQRLRWVIAGLLFMVALILSIPCLIGAEDNAMANLFVPICAIFATVVAVILANTWCMKK
ncbi:MAG: DUF3784 domain-containing protein [Muribaculaceae bacterium]|nr:DUF3784 domain-containing protein [Muribaculaceae bacterium]MBQ7206095.1 DUF3784 domain-containing protein [Muribaculaceae bacterium]